MLELADLSLNRGDQVLQRGEIGVVRCESSQEFPDAFDGIEFGTVRREEIQSE